MDTRDAAESVRGVTLYFARESLPEPNDGEFYHADLLGMVVKTQDGAPLGSLLAIHDFGAGEVAELAPRKGSTIMVPFGGDRLIAVDMAAKELCLAVPEGFLDGTDVADDAVRDKISQGKNEKEIYKFLVEKYGEWIVFKPLFNPNNFLLWILPYLLFLLGGILIFYIVRKIK